MKTKFTKKYLRENCGCYAIEESGKIEVLLSDVKGVITLQQILNSSIPLKDKYWFVCKKLATNNQNVKIAIGVAEVVLHLFENKYPKDLRPREAIEAAKNYLKTHSTAAISPAADAAAYAANTAAYAAANAAANAAAYAAYAANAAYAAYAANAAAYAANAAYAAANAANEINLNDLLLNFLVDFCLNPISENGTEKQSITN